MHLDFQVGDYFVSGFASADRHVLHRLWSGLKGTGVELANGRKVFNRNDAVVWLLEQLQERP